MKRKPSFALLFVGSLFVGSLSFFSCGTETEPGTDRATTTISPTPEAGIETPSGPPDGSTADTPPNPSAPIGFPCDVRAVLQTYCASCHAGHTYAPPFTTRADFLVPPGTGNWGARAAAQVEAGTMPQYGSKQPTAGERDALLNWVAAGMPAGSCGPLTAL